MFWKRGYRSSDVEIRKDSGGGGGGQLRGLFPLLFQVLSSRFGIFGGVAALGIVALLNSNLIGGGSQSVAPSPAEEAAERADPRVEFVSFVLDDIQSTWQKIFARDNRNYSHAKLIIFDRNTPTACGHGRAATGPFYCPEDRQVYLDLSFFRELEKLGGPGEFARAYVIAHEVGHHVQNLLGKTRQIDQSMHGATGAGGASVQIELQADCYAGVWARSTDQRKLLEAGDIESALGAAAAVGDDHLQKTQTGTVQPEAWTHGSSEQRKAAFQRGFKQGDPSDCETMRTAER